MYPSNFRRRSFFKAQTGSSELSPKGKKGKKGSLEKKDFTFYRDLYLFGTQKGHSFTNRVAPKRGVLEKKVVICFLGGLDRKWEPRWNKNGHSSFGDLYQKVGTQKKLKGEKRGRFSFFASLFGDQKGETERREKRSTKKDSLCK